VFKSFYCCFLGSARFQLLNFIFGAPILPPVPGQTSSKINASTRYGAVYGWPIRHSASPAMQNAGLMALGLNWRYLAFEVPPADLRKAIEGAEKMRFIGLNLTVPHKLMAVEMMDELDPLARDYQAVNTVRFEAQDAKGQWRPLGELEPEQMLNMRKVGFNTDADAVVRAVEEDLQMPLPGSSVLLLGAGGAGRVAALRFAAAGARALFMVNRTESKAIQVLDEIRSRFPMVTIELGYPPEGVDLVVNATSLGLKVEDPMPLDPGRFDLKRTKAVYDMIYRPAETALLRSAKQAGCQVANGLGMLLYQGAKALEIWTGKPAPLDVMRAALRENIYV
jgi:shikimate dehydrogenase